MGSNSFVLQLYMIHAWETAMENARVKLLVIDTVFLNFWLFSMNSKQSFRKKAQLPNRRFSSVVERDFSKVQVSCSIHGIG